MKSRTCTRACVGRAEARLLDQRARAGLLLVTATEASAGAVCVADGVLASLGDAGQQRLRGESAVGIRPQPRLYPAMPHML